MRMVFNEMTRQIKRCKHLIKNWDVVESLDLDFQDVLINGLFVDKQTNNKGEKWEISLLTTMHTIINKEGVDVYSVRWRFRDLWGNLPFFTLKGPDTTGALQLTSVDYDDFAVIIFRVISSSQHIIFEFSEPDETSIESVQLCCHQTLAELFPQDYPDGEELF